MISFIGDGTNRVKVFNVMGSDLAKLTYANFVNLQPGATMIINVSGDASMQGGVFQMLSNYNALLNFNTAQKLSFNQVGINASVLAPQATITGGSGVIDGNVIVKNWNTNMYMANNRRFNPVPLASLTANKTQAKLAQSVATANPLASAIAPASTSTQSGNSVQVSKLRSLATPSAEQIVLAKPNPVAESSAVSLDAMWDKLSLNLTLKLQLEIEKDLYQKSKLN